MESEKKVCSECKSSNFQVMNGRLVCNECFLEYPDWIEMQRDEFEGPSRGRTNKRVFPKVQEKKDTQNDLVQKWDIYDGFNVILVKMTDALIKCGAEPAIKSLVHKLWASYLSRMHIAFYDEAPDEPATGAEFETSIFPPWFTEEPKEDSETEKPTKNPALFAPIKIPKVKTGIAKRKAELKCLVASDDKDLSPKEIRQKNRIIHSNFIKVALAESGESNTKATASPDETDPITRKAHLQTTTSDTPLVKRTTEKAPEYLTLQKMLSFLHAALLMTGQRIFSGDLIRWVRECKIPFYGAHHLLPATMPLSGNDARILGAIGSRANEAPCSAVFRQNTARILKMLGYESVLKPPTYVVASKIIVDLQLPNELECFVKALDRIVHKGTNVEEWSSYRFGSMMKSECLYAGALVLVSMKLIFGLDGATEYKVSDFAEEVNNLFQLKPSSGFARHKLGSGHVLPQQSFMGVKTLFVWEEWVRMIEYRSHAIEKTHVPTAIRKGSVKKMDPDYVLHFAQNDGFLNCQRPTDTLSKLDSDILEIIKRAQSSFSSSPGPEKNIPNFTPNIFSMHGLALQLFKFDRLEYGLLKEEFPVSSLIFSLKRQRLATALKKANPPHRLKVNKGSARKHIQLTNPFLSTRNVVSQQNMLQDRYDFKIITVDPNIVSVSPDDETKDDGDEEAADEPSLLLFDPSPSYWITSFIGKNISKPEWKIFSAGLPPTFVWLMNLICESIEEKPRDFYEVFSQVEALVFLDHATVTKSLSTKKQIHRRIMSAKRSQFF